jgi:sulfur carrier protein
VIPITLNGEPRQIPTGLSVAGLIDQLGHAGRRIAVERNGEIVPKSQHGETLLAAGDRLEIVVAVGGG